MTVADPLKTIAAALLDGVNVRDPELRAELVELRDRGIDAVELPDAPALEPADTPAGDPAPNTDPEV